MQRCRSRGWFFSYKQRRRALSIDWGDSRNKRRAAAGARAIVTTGAAGAVGRPNPPKCARREKKEGTGAEAAAAVAVVAVVACCLKAVLGWGGC